ncbi:MAG: 3-dehydroquinate synthase [Ignavibacteria bacterium]|nr:MAG: 3-dehydroquinate synthase [Ignavibacteria bacterium]KAF0156689.1 MAG: 3-dehydroquinate synthase [Ignavibacteria bacterium]
MKKIEVKATSKNYPVYVGQNIFEQIPVLIEKKSLHKNVFIVVDENVLGYHLKRIKNIISEKMSKVVVVEYIANEKSKSSKSVEELYECLIKNNFGRDTLIIAIGGGITGDIVGFAASTFGRGVQFVQVPTTLLAAVDSSVGGKTGINYRKTKNLIGSFYQPEFVLIDTTFFKTLKEEEVVCGIGEIMKYAFLGDEKFYYAVCASLQNILKQKHQQTQNIIEACVNMKASVVKADETESGLRKILNLGHTFAHALEVEQDHKIKHGHAVIVGLTCALYLSYFKGILSAQKLIEYIELPLSLQNRISIDKCNIETVYKIMQRDKKSREGKIKFVLLSSPGVLYLDLEAEKETVITALEDGISHFI